MYAVMISGGKQYRVKTGDTLHLEKLDANPGDVVEFKSVMVNQADQLKLDAADLKKSLVKAEVLEHGRDEKIRIIKIKRRKHHMKRMGHRQWFTAVKITDIQV